jgi:hypothetical protein
MNKTYKTYGMPSPTKFRTALQTVTGGKSATGTPIFPGTQTGMDIEQVREFIMNQKRASGFVFNQVVGSTSVQISLPGDARILLGISFDTANVGDTFDLTINNNKFLDNVSTYLHSGNVLLNAGFQNFVSYSQPLASKNSIQLVSRSGGAFLNTFTVYYI